jgi:hypothetical protein
VKCPVQISTAVFLSLSRIDHNQFLPSHYALLIILFHSTLNYFYSLNKVPFVMTFYESLLHVVTVN